MSKRQMLENFTHKEKIVGKCPAGESTSKEGTAQSNECMPCLSRICLSSEETAEMEFYMSELVASWA